MLWYAFGVVFDFGFAKMLSVAIFETYLYNKII